jgi:ribosomal-protein-alanine N-acetyltransferase
MFTELALPKSQGRLRPIHSSDLDAMVMQANNTNVARYMTDRFANPYTRADGEAFLARLAGRESEKVFAVEIEGYFAGTLGFRPGNGERRLVCHIGYWLGENYWGRGIMTEAVRLSTDYLFTHCDFVRMETNVYAPNTASARVLEKCGFQREAILRKAALVEDIIIDDLLYAKVRP